MQDCIELDILTVTTTVGSLDVAKALARLIVDAKLAACVQIDQGLLSVYRWKGELCEDAEVRLTIKTLPECVPALQALFAEHHPYQVPQFVATRMQASEAYGAWARGEVEMPDT